MELVVDANVVISALIAESKTRELLVTIDPRLIAPGVLKEEIDRHTPMIVDKSGLPDRTVGRILDVFFQYIELVPTSEFHGVIGRAEQAIGTVDSADVVYLACAIARDAAIWSDDTDFCKQSLVPTYSTADVITRFGSG